LITINSYQPEYKEALIDVFKSNMPLYFAKHELKLFSDFLDKDALSRGPYSVILNNDEVVGSGGIALNNPTKYTPEPHVILTWGMVDNSQHKKGFGKELLKFRIEQAEKTYPGIKIALGTTQHTYRFFERFGFETVYYEKDHWALNLDLYQMELKTNDKTI
jgi:[ribosomal protein S18]-alanine N-acetyltransferase